jgi:hypothetical protein
VAADYSDKRAVLLSFLGWVEWVVRQSLPSRFMGEGLNRLDGFMSREISSAFRRAEDCGRDNGLRFDIEGLVNDYIKIVLGG